ncbi:MAG: acetyl-CoA carboxylase carboxyl transferase subunit beta, partial [Myxococcales bacterium]|nr:acetyl-CoA carboxylase carboxyl transferase subunit beta [Myxococcales bacterium]
MEIKRLTNERSAPSSAEARSLWTKCRHCGEVTISKEIERNAHVCPKCNYHMRISARKRIATVVEEGSFVELDPRMQVEDILHFRDTRPYREHLEAAEKATGEREAFIGGEAKLGDTRVCIGVFDFSFMGGSMGAVVGEKFTRLAHRAHDARQPYVVFTASGGARMQEGTISLMQMAKTSAAIRRLHDRAVPYITVLTDPTTGGVAASLAMLGDVIIAEPFALIGFAGPRV